ncbi:MAG TPA: ABC transporter substrate-binding protein [Stellaceae bacterium]|nr:ABC transporter substrate-binding protein [Stellaceae bacterium]
MQDLTQALATILLSLAAAAGLVAMALGLASPAAADATPLRVNMFSGPQDLAVFVAQEKGFYAQRGLAVEVSFTSSSQSLRDGMANGSFEIASSGVDNAVYMVDTGKADVAIVAGGDDGMTQLIVRPEIRSYADLRGKTVLVDAPDTAFAFQLYKMLELNGVKRADYTVVPKGGMPQRLAALKEDQTNAATMLNLPWNIAAEKAGFHSLGNAIEVLGPYQGTGIWVRRDWAAAHADTLVRYLQSTVEGLRWARETSSRAEAAAILARHLKIEPDLAAAALERALAPGGGLAVDARLDLEGFRNTLKLRAETNGGAPRPPETYLDLSYYERALAGL